MRAWGAAFSILPVAVPRTSPITSEAFAVAEIAARTGAAIVARYFRDGVTVRTKADDSLVTDADTESEAAIIAVIQDAFPDHAILAEEAHHEANAGAEHLWVIDPLDGTNNFAHGIPHFAVSIGYYRNGRAECGVVHNPVTDDWFIAARGQGAFWNGRPAHVASLTRLAEALVGIGFYYDRGAMMESTLAAIGDLFRHGVHGVRRFGAASLDLCWVGAGIFGAFFEYELAPWDFAAGRLFVEEAGGRVTTCTGEPLPLRSSTVLASNGHLHDALRALVEPHVPRVV